MPRLRAVSSVWSQQRRADAVALPRLLDADCGLRLARKAHTQRPQLGGAAQHAVDEKAVDHGVQRLRQIGIFADELVGHAAAEPAVAAIRIEAQHMIAVFCRFTDPQFADHAAFGRTSCIGSPDIVVPVKDTVVCETLPIVSSAQQVGATKAFAFTPNQIIMSCGAKVWQGEALSNMPTFRIRMARKLFTTV